jgi:hypothetical protein
MPCNKCHQNNTPCTCHQAVSICNQCPPELPCDCEIRDLGLKCTIFTGAPITEANILTNDNGETVIVKLVNYIKAQIASLQSSFSIISIGLGAKIYKGADALGTKEIRSITNSDNLIVIAENANDISVGVDETVLNTFVNNSVQSSLSTFNGANVGTGSGLIFRDKGLNIFNFRKLKTENTGIGASVLNVESTVSDNVVISAKKIKTDNAGIIGESILKTEVQGVDDITIIAKKLYSKTLDIKTDILENLITIEVSNNSSIPELYVNNNYVPSYRDFLDPLNTGKGEGSLLKPFTDTRIYNSSGVLTTTIPNTAIQNALNAYIGTGTALNPQKEGQEIIVQGNNYIFDGNFNASNLRLKISASIFTTTSDYLLNMDDSTRVKNVSNTIIIFDNGSIFIAGKGLLNSGTSTQTENYTTSRILTIQGNGVIRNNQAFDNNTTYLLNSDPNGTHNGTLGCNNDGSLCIVVKEKTEVSSKNNGIVKLGGKSKVEFNNAIAYSSSNINTIDVTSKVFVQNGGLFRFFNSLIGLSGGIRNVGFEFNPTATFDSDLIMRNTEFLGQVKTWFNKTTTFPQKIDIINSTSSYFGGITLFNSVNMWLVNFRNNVLEQIGIDFTNIDFTQGNTVSSTNTIGNNVIESLVKYPSRVLATIPIGSAFINTNGNDIDTNTHFRDIKI